MVTASPYRITSKELIKTIDNWESLINFKVKLIGCGGTALTLLGIKDSTKDVDFIVPVPGEYARLMKFLWSLGYKEKGGGREKYLHQKMAPHLFGCLEPNRSHYNQDVSRDTS
jgi:hypothetical protein